VNGDGKVQQAHAVAETLLTNVETVVRGKNEQIKLVISALAAGGHVLLEDVPGTAKTVLAKALASSIRNGSTQRLQCTPDLQPSDVTGLSIWDAKKRIFEFRPGPVFANVVLVDEVNRAMPKTQSALLEAMAERQVTVDGETRKLPAPFLVIATENPIEHAGTFPLPEAQLDRFFIRTALGYPSPEQEFEILTAQTNGHPLDGLKPVVTRKQIEELQAAIGEVYIDAALRRWIIALVGATRDASCCRMGSSVRGSLALDRAARAYALVEGRDHVTPSDIEYLFAPVIEHRVILRPSAERGVSLLEECAQAAPRPGKTSFQRPRMR
jgi:MoxR-like ATPase